MKLLYIVNTKNTEEAYRVYAKVHMEGKVSALSKVISIILGVIITAGGAMAVVNHGPRLLYLISIVVGVLCIFSQPLGLAMMRRRLLKHTDDMQLSIDYRFGEDNYALTFSGDTKTFRYDDLVRIVETDGYYFLYPDIRMAYILPKKDFTQGDAKGFAAFLEEKSGKKLEHIKA